MDIKRDGRGWHISRDTVHESDDYKTPEEALAVLQAEYEARGKER